MGRVKVKAGQSLLDIAIQECGGLSALAELAAMNGLSITSDLPVLSELRTPSPADDKVALLFANMEHKPATSVEAVGGTYGGRIFDDTFDQTFE